MAEFSDVVAEALKTGPQDPVAAAATPAQPDPGFSGIINEGLEASRQEDELDAQFTAWKATQSGLTPDRALDVLHVARATRKPVAFVAENLEELRKTADENQLRQAALESPTLQRYMQDPARAAFVKDKLDDVGTWEWLLGRWERVPTQRWDPLAGAYIRELRMASAPAWAQAARGSWAENVQIPALAAKILTGTATPEDEARLQKLEEEWAGRTYGANNPATKALIGVPKMLPFIVGQGLVRAAGGALGAGATVIAGGGVAGPGGVVASPVGALVGQYAAGAAFDFFQNVGPLYMNLRRLKNAAGDPLLEDDEAKAYAVSASLGLSALTAGIGGELVKRTPWVGDVLKRQAQRGVEQAFAELGGAQAVKVAAKTYGKHVASGAAFMATIGAGNAATVELARAQHGETASWDQVADAAKHGALVGLQDMLLLAAWAPARSYFREFGILAQSEGEAARLEAFAEHAKSSKILDAPEQGEELLGQVALAQGAPRVLADPTGWNSYWTSKGFDARKVAAEVAGDNGAQYDRVASGLEEDLAFPIERYTSRFGKTEHVLGLKPDVKLSGESRTPRQQKKWAERLDALADQAKGTGADERLLELDGLEHGKFLEVLAAAPHLGEDHAHSVAATFRRAIAFFGQETGLTPAQIAQEFPIPIHAPEKAPPALQLKVQPAPRAAAPKQAKPTTQGVLAGTGARDVEDPAARLRELNKELDQVEAKTEKLEETKAPTPEMTPELQALILAAYRGDKAAIASLAAKVGAQAPKDGTLRVASSETRIVTPQRPQGERATYRAIEAEELIASHDPDSFQPDPRYPAGVQEREYHRQVEEQLKVTQGAQRLNPAMVLSDVPEAVSGPPMVTAGARALVLGGNGRAMMLRRAMREEATRNLYREALLERAGSFGLDRAELEKMKAPVLVRVMEEVGADAPKEDLVAAVRRTNEGMTQALSPKARAVAEAKNLSDGSVGRIGELLAAHEGTLRELMAARPGDLVEVLQRDGLINAQNRSSWLNGANLTDEAKDRIEGMFLGRVVGSGDRLAQTAPAVLQKLERAAPHLLRVQGVNPAMDEVGTVQVALDVLNDARRRGMSIQDLTAQTSLLGDAAIPAPVALLATILESSKPKALAERFKAWADVAAFDPRQVSMFAPNPTLDQAREKLLGAGGGEADGQAALLQRGAVVLDFSKPGQPWRPNRKLSLRELVARGWRKFDAATPEEIERATLEAIRDEVAPLEQGKVELGQPRKKAPAAEEVVRNLVVQHNMRAENLLHADELGGLAVPSIAVSSKDAPLLGFGEVTLLAPKELVDPKTGVPIFDADVYSPRHPSTLHRYKERDAAKLRAELAPLADLTDGYVGELRMHLEDKGVAAWKESQIRPLLELAFLRERGLEPAPIAKPRTMREGDWSKRPEVRAFFEAHPEVTDPSSTVEYRTDAFDAELSAAVGAAIRGHFAERIAEARALPKGAELRVKRMEKLRDEMLFAYLGPKGELSSEKVHRLLEDARNFGKVEPDRDEMMVRVVETIHDRGLQESFEAWAKEKIRGVLTGDRYFSRYSETTGDRRAVPATLDNLVREMKRLGLQGAEGNTGGLGWMRAHGARRFRKLEEIQADRARVVSKDTMEGVQAALNGQWDQLVGELQRYHDGPLRFGMLDDLAAAVVAYYQRKSVADELRAAGFKDVPAEVVQKLEAFAEGLRTAPTEYFEAKPQRAVRLQEFKVAVVPRGVEAEVRPVLERHGIQVEVFDTREGSADHADREADRRAAIAAAAEKHALLFQGDRGRVKFTVPGTPTAGVELDLALLSGADESTAAHELGHWMGLVLGQLAGRPESSDAIRELYGIALKEMGYADHGERLAALSEIQEINRKQKAGPLAEVDEKRLRELEAREERISHAFELYLAEGKPPTAELGRVFTRFKLWMFRIYRGLDGIRETYRAQYGSELELSPEVRRMFDRILGAEETARQVELDAEGALLEDAVRALPDQRDQDQLRQAVEAERAATRDHLLRVLTSEELKERQRFMADEREKIAGEVAAELDAEPGYRAQAFLRYGKIPEGMPVPPELVTDAGEPRLLDRAEAVQRYGADWVRQNLRGMVTNDQDRALPLDLAAEALGFKTGDELVREVAKLPARGEVIRARVQERLEARYGTDLLQAPEKLAEEALEATHGIEAARRIFTGLRILARRLNPDLDPRFRAIDVKELERRAFDYVQERPLAEVSPARELRAERAAGRKALELLASAARAKDEGTRRQVAAAAFDAHETQLFNFYVWKASKEIAERNGKRIERLREFLGPRKRAVLVKAGHDYAERVDDLLGAIELRASRSMAEVQRRRAILEASGGIDPARDVNPNPQAAYAMVAWLEQQKALNRDPFVPDRVLELLKRTTHWKELSDAQLGELHDSVQSIFHLAKVKDTLLTSKGRRERKAILDELNQRLFATFGDHGIVVDRNTLAFKKRALRAVKRLRAGIIRPEEFFREADGGDPSGPFTRYLWEPVSDAHNAWGDLVEKLAKPVVEALERAPIQDKTRWKTTRFTVKGQPYTMEAALAVAFNWGTESNRHKLKKGWRYGGLEKFGLQAWDEETPQEFLRHLTESDWRFVEQVWKQLESLWPEMEALERRMTGLVPPKIPALKFQVVTAEGRTINVQGGYYPMVYDRRFSHAGAAGAEKDSLGAFQLYQPGAERAITPHGHLNARQEEFARPVELSLYGLQRHLSHATKDLAMREALISVYDIVTDSSFRAAIQRTAGEEVLPLLDKWVRDTANDLVLPDGGEGQWIEFQNQMRSGLTGSVFAFNAAQSLQNLTGMANALDRVDAGYLWRGVEELMSQRGKLVDEIKEASGEMRQRARNLDRDLPKQLHRRLGKEGVLGRSRDVAMWAFHASDAVVAYATWRGAYLQALDGKVEGVARTHKDAVRWADSTVRLSLTANATKDLPALMRSPHAKWFTMFAGWASSRLNRLLAATTDAKQDWRDQAYHRALRRLTRITFWFMAGAILSDLATGKGATDDDEDGKVDGTDWAKWSVRRAALAPLNVIPIAGPIVRAAADGFRGVSLAPVERIYSTAAATLSSGGKAAGKLLAGEDEWSEDLADFGLHAVESAAYATGLPVSQARATLGYWLDTERNGDSFGETALGTVYGKRRRGSLGSALYGEE